MTSEILPLGNLETIHASFPPRHGPCRSRDPRPRRTGARGLVRSDHGNRRGQAAVHKPHREQAGPDRFCQPGHAVSEPLPRDQDRARVHRRRGFDSTGTVVGATDEDEGKKPGKATLYLLPELFNKYGRISAHAYDLRTNRLVSAQKISVRGAAEVKVSGTRSGATLTVKGAATRYMDKQNASKGIPVDQGRGPASGLRQVGPTSGRRRPTAKAPTRSKTRSRRAATGRSSPPRPTTPSRTRRPSTADPERSVRRRTGDLAHRNDAPPARAGGASPFPRIPGHGGGGR
jgi:hypothetical protein